LCYFTTDFTDNTGNGRVVSNNGIRQFIGDPDSYLDLEIHGESIRGDLCS